MRTRLKCKATTNQLDDDGEWQVVFQEGKWYDFDENWQGADGVGEDGILHKRSRGEMRATFFYTEVEQKMALRDDKIDKILK